MSLNTTSSSSQYLTAFFDNRSDAEAAADRIVDAGVARSDIRIVAGADTSTTSATTATPERERGFFEALGDFFMPDEDRYSYAEGLRRGGYLLSVPTTGENRDRILDILDDEGTIDMDAREESWRSEGWTSGATTRTAYDTGLSTDTTGLGGSQSTAGYGAGISSSSDKVDYTALDTSRAGYGATRDADMKDRDGTIEVVEENLRVGKRDVSHGRVRVRSYVVEEPVSQDVNLRSERVEVERRAVDRPAGNLDAAFRDQTLELEETAEEAVISKDARVTEEIDLNRVAENRTQTVSDTVRRTEVEIDDGRSSTSEGTRLSDEELARRDRS